MVWTSWAGSPPQRFASAWGVAQGWLYHAFGWPPKSFPSTWVCSLNLWQLLNQLGFIGLVGVVCSAHDKSTVTHTQHKLNQHSKVHKFNEYSEIHYDVLYDLVTNNENEYTIGYSYFDECFGINLDFTRKFYTDRELKPNDSLLLMFSFKNLGSYQSSNIAVSEFDKQDIEWVTKSVDNDLFN